MPRTQKWSNSQASVSFVLRNPLKTSSKISDVPNQTIQSSIPSIDANFSSSISKQSYIETNKNTGNSSTVPENQINSDEPLVTEQKPRQNYWFWIVLIAVVATLCLIVAVLTPVLITVLNRSTSEKSITTYKSSICSSTTCIGHETPYGTTPTALFAFDRNYNDLYGRYAGVPFGSSIPSFSSGTNYISDAIDLIRPDNEYVVTSGFSFKDTSFTIQFWFFVRVAGSSTDYGLFSHCDSNSVCLGISVRSGRITLSFDAMNSSANVLVGSTVTRVSYWTHVTIVYDMNLQQQRIYVDGVIDSISNSIINPYRGHSSGAVSYMGLSSSFSYPSSLHYGFLDHLIISIGTVRSDCEIYNDATLFVYYSFDTVDTWKDRSVNRLHGILTSTTVKDPGRIGQSIAFNSSASYFQAPAFPTIRPAALPFSITLWIKPYAVVGGASLIHISALSSGLGSPCYDLLGFTATGLLVAQLITSSSAASSITGSILPLDTWTHIALIYSSSNGFRLFIDGQFINSVSGSISNNQYNMYVTLGTHSPGTSASLTTCISSSIVPGAFRGEIDEFRVYLRELNSQELCVLMDK